MSQTFFENDSCDMILIAWRLQNDLAIAIYLRKKLAWLYGYKSWTRENVWKNRHSIVCGLLSFNSVFETIPRIPFNFYSIIFLMDFSSLITLAMYILQYSASAGGRYGVIIFAPLTKKRLSLMKVFFNFQFLLI